VVAGEDGHRHVGGSAIATGNSVGVHAVCDRNARMPELPGEIHDVDFRLDRKGG
jgi:hypothetical protein